MFTFRGDAQRDRARIEIAKNGVKRLKTIRHPNVLLMKETVEIESGNEITIHVVTEATTPLAATFAWSSTRMVRDSTDWRLLRTCWRVSDLDR